MHQLSTQHQAKVNQLPFNFQLKKKKKKNEGFLLLQKTRAPKRELLVKKVKPGERTGF